ncbi:MAG TPA: outer membrane beta-barrel protein [Gammaproteobacteria bacterium]|nr:outer membrane beta-barrel protein [Gammaproteobacteria bacterium]
MRSVSAVLLGLMLCTTPAMAADTLGFSWLGASFGTLRPEQGARGHAETLTLGYALSDQAFMYADGDAQHFDTADLRRYDFGVGINSDPAAGYVVFATVGWNNLGVDAAPAGRRRHGFDASAGVRALLAPHWEVYARARYTHNPLAGASSDGAAGVRYQFTPSLSLDLGVDVAPEQTAWRLGLRLYY